MIRIGPGPAPETEEDQEVARAGLPRGEQSRAPRAPYALFVAAYRDAAEKLRAGIRDVVFPRGSFPPALPFVGR